MCCVNSVLLRASSFFCGLTVLSGLLTCVDVCSVAGITAQVNTLHLGLWGDSSSEGQAQADISVFLSVSLTLPVFLVLLRCPFFHISHNSSKTTLSAPPLSCFSLVHRPAACTLQLSAQYNCNLSDFVDPLEAAIQSIKSICSILPCHMFVWLSCALLCVSVALTLSLSLSFSGWRLDPAFVQADAEESERPGRRKVHLRGRASLRGVVQQEAHHQHHRAAR